MPILSLIVAMSKNRVIGRNNQLPWHLPEDLKYFKKVTLGHPIIMGRKTFESIGRPLPGRLNVVITRQAGYQPAGVEVVHSFDEALRRVESGGQLAISGRSEGTRQTPPPVEVNSPEVFVIGGAEIFKEAIPRATRVYLTVIDHEVAGDVFLPELPGELREVSREDHVSETAMLDGAPIRYRFLKLERA